MPAFRVRAVVILFLAGCMIVSNVLIPTKETKAFAPFAVGGAMITKEVAILLTIGAMGLYYEMKNRPKQKSPVPCYPLLPEKVNASSTGAIQPLCKTITEEPPTAWPKLYVQALAAVEKVCPKSDKKCLDPWKKKLEKLVKSIQKNLALVFASFCRIPFPLIAESVASFCAKNHSGGITVSRTLPHTIKIPSSVKNPPSDGTPGESATRVQPTASAPPTKNKNNQGERPNGSPRHRKKIPIEEEYINQLPEAIKPRVTSALSNIPSHVKELLIEIMRTKKGTLSEKDKATKDKIRRNLNYQLQTIFRILEHYNNLKMNVEMYEMYTDKNDVNQSLGKVLDSLEKIFHAIKYKQVNPQNYPPLTHIEKISRANQSLLESIFPEKEDRKLLERFYKFTGTEN